MAKTYNQPTKKPTPKVAAGGTAGALTVVVVLLLSQFGVEVPESLIEEAMAGVGALVALVTFLAAYFKRDTKETE